MTRARACITALCLTSAALSATVALAAAQVPTTPRVNTRALKPDLEITIQPRTLVAGPTRFIVHNRGLAAASAPSLLRVRVTLLPLTSENMAEYQRVMGRSIRDDGRFADACKSTGDFEAAVRALRPGESQTVTPPRPSIVGTGVAAPINGARATAAQPEGSSVRSMKLEFRCVYEIRVQVDANGEIAESDEGNNAIVHRFQRDVDVDLLRYYR